MSYKKSRGKAEQQDTSSFCPSPSTSSSSWYYSILKQSGKKPDDRNQSKLIFITIVDSRSIYHNYWTFTEIMLLITRGNDWCINVKIRRWNCDESQASNCHCMEMGSSTTTYSVVKSCSVYRIQFEWRVGWWRGAEAGSSRKSARTNTKGWSFDYESKQLLRFPHFRTSG